MQASDAYWQEVKIERVGTDISHSSELVRVFERLCLALHVEDRIGSCDLVNGHCSVTFTDGRQFGFVLHELSLNADVHYVVNQAHVFKRSETIGLISPLLSAMVNLHVIENVDLIEAKPL